MPSIHIRPAVAADCAAINGIYNYYVLHSTTTYQTEPETLEGRLAWLAARGGPHPVTVAEVDGVIVGWGALSRFHPRAAYARTVENAVYVAHDRLGQGIGRAILADLLARAKQLGHHTVIALISAEQAGSLALHAKLGFERVGLLREAGFKMGRWLDVVYMQRMVVNGEENANVQRPTSNFQRPTKRMLAMTMTRFPPPGASGKGPGNRFRR